MENAVVGGVDNQVGIGEIAGDGEARAGGILIHDELIVVPAKAGADGPFTEVDEILNVG